MIRDGNLVLHPQNHRMTYRIDGRSGANLDALRVELAKVTECRDFIEMPDAVCASIAEEIAYMIFQEHYGRAVNVTTLTFVPYNRAAPELVRAYLLKFCALERCYTHPSYASGSSEAEYDDGVDDDEDGEGEGEGEEEEDDYDAFTNRAVNDGSMVSEHQSYTPLAVDDAGVWYDQDGAARGFLFHAATITTHLTYARIATILAALPPPKYARRPPRATETAIQYLKYLAEHL